MKRKMTINGKTYDVPEIGYNEMCKLEDMGVALDPGALRFRLFSTLRGFVALAIGNPEIAGRELEEHLKSGSGIEEIVTKMSEAFEESDFFQQMNKQVENQTKPKKSNTQPGKK